MAHLQFDPGFVLPFHQAEVTQHFETKQGHGTDSGDREQEVVEPHVELIATNERSPTNRPQTQEHLNDAWRKCRVAIMGTPFDEYQHHHIAEEAAHEYDLWDTHSPHLISTILLIESIQDSQEYSKHHMADAKHHTQFHLQAVHELEMVLA